MNKTFEFDIVDLDAIQKIQKNLYKFDSYMYVTT